MPASASAPAITINSICVEPDCFCKVESAAARESGEAAGCGAGLVFADALAGGSAAASWGSFDELTPEESGQRAVTDEGGAAPVGAVARRPFWVAGTAAAGPVRG